MFWNDISEMKEEIRYMKRAIDEIVKFNRIVSLYFSKKDIMKECGLLTEEHEGEEEISINDLSCKLDEIIDSVEAVEKVIPDLEVFNNPESILFKFDERMSKVESMLNEFKGCVSMARDSFEDKKDRAALKEEFTAAIKYIKECVISTKLNQEEAKKNATYALSLHNQHFKIDAIYNYLEQLVEQGKEPKKPKKAKTST